MKNYIFTAVLLFLTISLSAQPIPKYKDASQPIEVRVQDLLSRMKSSGLVWDLSLWDFPSMTYP